MIGEGFLNELNRGKSDVVSFTISFHLFRTSLTWMGVCVPNTWISEVTYRKSLSTFPLYLSRTSPGLVRSRLILITNNNTVVGIARGPPTQLHPWYCTRLFIYFYYFFRNLIISRILHYSQRVMNVLYIEDQAFSWSYDFAPPHRLPPLLSISSSGDTRKDWERERTGEANAFWA